MVNKSVADLSQICSDLRQFSCYFAYMSKVSLKEIPIGNKERVERGYRWKVFYPSGTGDNRARKYFKRKTEAESFIAEKKEEIERHGSREKAITKAERDAIMHFRKEVAKLPNNDALSIREAVEQYLERADLRHKSIECRDVADKLVQVLKNQKGRRPRTISDVKSRLDAFNAEYGDRLACDISTDIVNEYLLGLKVAQNTIRNHRRVLSQMFAYAVKIGAALSNPVTEAEEFEYQSKKVGVLTPKQLTSLLFHADDKCAPAIAISFFAGVRSAEILRLDWSAIDLESREIVIDDEISKKSARRVISISDNLAAWLKPHAKESGFVAESEGILKRSYTEAREKAGIVKWPHNAGRHSFASYHLRHHKDPNATARELGHNGDVTMLNNHYKSIVKVGAAATYWSIMPDDVDNIAAFKKA